MDREELDPDGAIEDQVADNTNNPGNRDPGDDSSDEAEKGRNHCSHPDLLFGRTLPVHFILSLARIISRCLLCLHAHYENHSMAEPVAQASAGRSIRVVQRWFIRVLKNLERGLREKGEGDGGSLQCEPDAGTSTCFVGA
jgi:hypothetical protein